MQKMYSSSLYGSFRTRRFNDIFPNEETFMKAVTESEIPVVIKQESLKTLYYLLYARYGNSCIASSDENQFKYKVYSTIFMYGSTWEKRLEIQHDLAKLTPEEILEGSTAIYNSANNPSTELGLTEDGKPVELSYINSQNTTRYRRSKVDGYANLYQMLVTDVTESFLVKFKKLFIVVVQPEAPLYYVTEGEEDDA